jgi:hypothetical protein
MAKRRLTRWHVSRRGTLATVFLHGIEPHFLSSMRVMENFRITVSLEEKTDQKAMKALVKRAMEMSEHTWVGRV